MSKGIVQRKSNLKRDPSIGDEETNRRRPCYQLMEKEKQRKNQLGILQEILFHHRNGNIKSEKFIPKNNIIRNGQKTKVYSSRPTSMKTSNSEEGLKDFANSTGEEEKSVRPSRLNRKDNQPTRTIRSASLYSQSHQHSNNVRSTNNVSFMSDKSTESTSPRQLTKLLARLSTEFNDLESNRCNTSLSTTLIKLTGYVKECASNSKEINNLKDQITIFIKTQLDFQQKIENQITTLQTMMQTMCQLVNNEILSNRKFNQNQNYLTNPQKPYLIPKDPNNAMNELLMFTRTMNNGTPMDTNPCQSACIETLETSKKLTRPISAVSTNGNDMCKHIQQYRTRSIDTGTPNGNSSGETLQTSGTSNVSTAETILEKILHERLRLVQQMNELNKQHEMTQEELANLEAKTLA